VGEGDVESKNPWILTAAVPFSMDCSNVLGFTSNSEKVIMLSTEACTRSSKM